MEFLLLGPVEVRDGERRLAPGGSKQRALLAMLLLNAGEVVSSTRLIEGLWGEEPPATAPKMLQVFVSRLRSEIGGTEVIETRAPGYMANVGPDQLDLLRFETLVGKGRGEMTTDPPRAAATLREALSLWRGPPLSNVSIEPFAQLAIPKLDEMRLSTLEDRIDADLTAGRHHQVVAELRDLVAQNPLRERERGQLMLALYRDGRQAEALQAYRTARETLIDELGVEPSRELQQLETAILNQDPALDTPRPAVGDAASTSRGSDEEDVRSRPQSERPWRRVAVVVGVVVVATVAIAAALGRGGTPSGRAPVVAANSVAIVDPTSGTVLDDIPVGTNPGPITISEDSAWVGNVGDRTIERIDLTTRAPLTTFGNHQLPPSSLAYRDGFSGTISRLIVASGQLSPPFYPVGRVTGQLAIATSPGDLWVGLANQDLVRIDPVSLKLKATFLLPFKPLALSMNSGVAWSISFPGYGKFVARTDPASRPSTTSTPIPGDPKVLATGDEAVWVGATGGNRLWKIDPSDVTVVNSVGLAASPSAIAVQPGAVWVAGGSSGILERIDPADDAVTMAVTLGRPIGGITIASGELWVTLD
jgi:DNA-binding SARP family transcriptional activator